MYELLNAPIPDIEAYLRRLGMEEENVKNDRAYLNRLVYAHQRMIIFENLDVYPGGGDISLEIPALFEKVVLQKRGGYCFELNALFTRLLQDLGYDAWSCLVRIVRGKDFIPPTLHRGILVRIEGEIYYCDVGYGGPVPTGTIALAEGNQETIQGETFYTKRRDETWWILGRVTSQGEREDVLEFYTMPQDNANFVPISYYCSHSPDSVFTMIPFLNRRLDDGMCSVMGDTFTLRQGRDVITKKIQNEEEFEEIRRQYFQV